LQPDPDAQTIRGTVAITLNRPGMAGDALTLDRGDLEIESVNSDRGPLRFDMSPRQLVIRFADPTAHHRRITIGYRGTPKSGLVFFPERRVMYTLFATSQWMVAQDAPSQRATLRLRLVVPRSWSVVSNGREVARRHLSSREDVSEWRQERAVPTYTFGFVAGELSTTTSQAQGTRLRYVSAAGEFSTTEMQRIFGESARMLAFYQRRAGVRYPGPNFAQILVPRTAGQEMAGFSVVSEGYARAVLVDPLNGSLLAHELAHQWWGNMVTCRDWTEFWLNEGVATFMAAA
jgi:aminopeptidase N